ncbi:MAG: AMP phosphorylase [Nanoarchaeota archaeon]
MKFKVKDMDIATGGILVAILNQKDAKKLDLHYGDRLLVSDGKPITCILDISESHKAVPPGSVGLFEEVLDKLGVKGGDEVEVTLTGKPESLKHIRSKLFGKELGYKELYHIMDDITHDRLTDIEKTYFVSGGFINEWSVNEVVQMTKAIVDTGNRLNFGKMILDKHCIGGVPGNRTTMAVVPIVAAAGFKVPKTSSRAITSPAGTADTMECLANVELTEKEVKTVVKKTGACIVHGGSMNLAPADDKIIKVEHPLSIDPEGQLLASVMAKKYSVSASHVLIDIPMGRTVKATNRTEAMHLKKMFELVGKRLGMEISVIITDGSQPIGNGVGPLLEAMDVLAVLRNEPKAPQDLREKVVKLAGLMLEMTDRYKKGSGIKAAEEILSSGKAIKKMHEIIDAQGRQKMPFLGEHRYLVHSKHPGKIREINNEIIAKAARVAGAPEDKGSGLYLHRKVGDSVKKNELLYTIYAESQFKLKEAKSFISENNGYALK